MEVTVKPKNGFTIIEVMLSLTILAILMTAVAFAFDASITNYNANEDIYKTVNTARQALLRITNDLRTAEAVALIGSGDPDNSQVSLLKNTGNDIAYRFDNSTTPGILYYDDIASGNSYVLCDNVTAATFDRSEHEIERDTNGDGSVEPITAVRDVRIVLTVTDSSGDISRTLAAATLVRKNQ